MLALPYADFIGSNSFVLIHTKMSKRILQNKESDLQGIDSELN